MYDATGDKVKKTVFQANGTMTYKYYAQGAEFDNMYYAPTTFYNGEGRLNFNGNTNTWFYEYALKDHLGNTRVVFSDMNGDGKVDPFSEVSQINHYSPFGLNLEGNWNGAAGAYKKQYNGKEWHDDLGLNLNDYGARWYDPAIGRWGTIDPLSEKYRNLSPYNYVANNPIIKIDPSGMNSEDPKSQAITSTHTDSNGKVVAVFDDGDLGVYSHWDWEKDKAAYSATNTSANGTKRGETLLWNSFADDRNHPQGYIQFFSFEARDWISDTYEEIELDAMLVNSTAAYLDYAAKAGNSERYDFKSKGNGDVYRGSQLSNGVYISARDVGNWMAGAVGKLTKMEKKRFLEIAGAFNAVNNNKMRLAEWLVTGKPKNFWPYYGEDPRSNTMQRLGYHNITNVHEFTCNMAIIYCSDK